MQQDEILLRGLDLTVWIGVPDEERAAPQVLQADVVIEPGLAFDAMGDEIARTIDYAAVAQRLRAMASERPRRLIETLAAELAAELVGPFGAQRAVVELRKRILPGVDYVAVRCERHGHPVPRSAADTPYPAAPASRR